MVRIAVCDDRKDEAERLLTYIGQYADRCRVSVETFYFSSGDELLKAFTEGKAGFGLIFMGILMQGRNGMEAARELRKLDKKVPLVFLTSSRDFAVESYEVEAAGYLLKPFTEERMEKLLNKFLWVKEKKRLAVKSHYSYHYLDYEEIRYVESRGHSLLIYLTDEIVTIAEKLDNLEEQLEDCRFLRCHQSYLVNMDYVHRVEEDFILRDGVRVPIRSKEKRRIAEAYYQYFVDKKQKQTANFAD